MSANPAPTPPAIAAGAALHFRVDARLVHATTLSGWVPALEARTLLVLDAEVCGDRERRAIMALAAHGEIDLAFASELDAQAAVERALRHGTVLGLFASLDAAARARHAGLELDRLVVGHLPSGPGRLELAEAVWVSRRELDIAAGLAREGVELVVQPLPTDAPVPLASITPLDVEPRRTRESLESLPTTTSPPPPPRHSSAPPAAGPRVSDRLVVTNPKGLHLRAAQALAVLAGGLSADIWVRHDGEEVNARSMLALTSLGADHGTELDVEVQGPDAAAVLEQVRALFSRNFGEETS